MSMQISCSKCEALLAVPDDAVGKKAKCKKCGNIFEIKQPTSEPSAGQNSSAAALSNSFGATSPSTAPASNSPDPFAAAGPSPSVTAPLTGTPSNQSNPYATTPPANPYNTPSAARPGSQPLGAGDSLSAVQPLVQAAGWITFIGWFALILGSLYSLLIIPIIITWMPIWAGVCLIKAGNALKNGGQNPHAVTTASSNLKTAFTLFGVMAIVWLLLMSLYVIFLLGAFVVAVSRAA